MPLSLETRIAMLGVPEARLPAGVVDVVTDWAARCDRITAHGKAAIDPFTLAIPAVLSPIGAPNAVAWQDFMLSDCEIWE